MSMQDAHTAAVDYWAFRVEEGNATGETPAETLDRLIADASEVEDASGCPTLALEWIDDEAKAEILALAGTDVVMAEDISVGRSLFVGGEWCEVAEVEVYGGLAHIHHVWQDGAALVRIPQRRWVKIR